MRDGLLSSFGLKRIAIASMVIDHTGSFLLRALMEPYRMDGMLVVNQDSPSVLWQLMQAREVCDILGSVAFPIFCFLAAEGFLHTRNRVRYGVQMACFALASEIPFDLAHYHTWFSPRLQNVMFTLACAILTLLLVSKAEERWAAEKPVRWGIIAAITAAGMVVAYLIRGEYVFLGVLAVTLVYLLRGKGKLRVAGLAPLLVASPWTALAVPLLLLYNGRRGEGSKWFFYFFYPVHFLVFAALAAAIAG
ncbi:MAG: hypothetical protein HFF11_05710 [Angelakisella sp.]|nr:hypothetical protein [Angelakisella sp.]